MVTESEIVARYAETDRMGVVYHANYLVWMEVGRTDYLAALGFPYSRLELLQSRKVAFAYRVLRGTELVVSGRTEHVCVDAKMRVRKIPAPLFEALGRSFDGAN